MEQIKSLILRLTEQCNLCCSYCYACRGSSARMSEETVLRAIALCCPEGGSLRVQLTGGEPLLEFELIQRIAHFGRHSNRRLQLAIQTNGTLLNPEISRALAAMHCAVGVSLDGLEESNRLRLFPDGSPSYAAAIQGIRSLGEAGLRCNLTTVISCANARHLGQLPDLALWLGNVAGVGLDLFRPLGRGIGKPFTPAETDLKTGLTELVHKTVEIQRVGIPFRLRELERLKQRASCHSCGSPYCYAQTENSLCVDAEGDLWPCSSFAGCKDYYLGNLRDGLPTRPRTSLALEAPEECRCCPSFAQCGGGCPAGRSSADPQRDHLTCVIHKLLQHKYGGIQPS